MNYYGDNEEQRREEYAERCFMDFISRPIFGGMESIDNEGDYEYDDEEEWHVQR